MLPKSNRSLFCFLERKRIPNRPLRLPSLRYASGNFFKIENSPPYSAEKTLLLTGMALAQR
jgi:hypothetical protein